MLVCAENMDFRIKLFSEKAEKYRCNHYHTHVEVLSIRVAQQSSALDGVGCSRWHVGITSTTFFSPIAQNNQQQTTYFKLERQL